MVTVSQLHQWHTTNKDTIRVFYIETPSSVYYHNISNNSIIYVLTYANLAMIGNTPLLI